MTTNETQVHVGKHLIANYVDDLQNLNLGPDTRAEIEERLRQTVETYTEYCEKLAEEKTAN